MSHKLFDLNEDGKWLMSMVDNLAIGSTFNITHFRGDISVKRVDCLYYEATHVGETAKITCHDLFKTLYTNQYNRFHIIFIG